MVVSSWPTALVEASESERTDAPPHTHLRIVVEGLWSILSYHRDEDNLGRQIDTVTFHGEVNGFREAALAVCGETAVSSNPRSPSSARVVEVLVSSQLWLPGVMSFLVRSMGSRG